MQNTPIEVRDRILMHIPDLSSLQSVVMASKRIYDVYKLRKRSIICAVERNEVGPALPYAIALIRTQRDKARMLEDVLRDLSDENNAYYWDADGSVAEALALREVSKVVRQLEDHYSCL